ncbi:hypothetical protein GMI69_00885 [Eggerthellaceae bacterium zg-887]|uniref:TetR/AcrR family transcriptional regulator n=1 Tax=Xiamenia xianingshaonis TaxID=2682776 RepID=UPI00140AADC4|nr:TetR/AcrR family transcriptional regulator [Xiamenia xianingshaonis]NHM15231.1 hypothetical protein [Xiamenia xianingshaonis]
MGAAKTGARGAKGASGTKAPRRRARTDEQKQSRLADILDAAERLLDGCACRDVTMTRLAEDVGCSRTNLAHYVASKEEVFLLLYVRSLQSLFDDARALLENRLVEGARPPKPTELAKAARLLAPVVVRHADFGRVGALLAGVAEANVTPERLVACKATVADLLQRASDLLASAGLLPSPACASEFLLGLSWYAAGRYPAAHSLPIWAEASQTASCPQQDYELALRRYLEVQLAGYWALEDAAQGRTEESAS